ncbi:MAG: MalM family protein [Ferruginibacter sp.]
MGDIVLRFHTTLLIQILISMLIIIPVFAQTADTGIVDTTIRPVNTTAKMSPLKKLVSDVAGMLAQQQQYYTLSFDTSKSIRCRIEKSAPLYKLPGGESRAVLFMLPAYNDEYMLTIRSMVHGFGFTWHIFAPTVVFLDSLFTPTRLLPEKQFTLINSSTFQGPSLRAEVRMKSEHSTDKYLLIFTMKSGNRLDTYSDAGTVAPVMLNHPVEGSPDGKLELQLHRN